MVQRRDGRRAEVDATAAQINSPRTTAYFRIALEDDHSQVRPRFAQEMRRRRAGDARANDSHHSFFAKRYWSGGSQRAAQGGPFFGSAARRSVTRGFPQRKQATARTCNPQREGPRRVGGVDLYHWEPRTRAKQPDARECLASDVRH